MTRKACALRVTGQSANEALTVASPPYPLASRLRVGLPLGPTDSYEAAISDTRIILPLGCRWEYPDVTSASQANSADSGCYHLPRIPQISPRRRRRHAHITSPFQRH